MGKPEGHCISVGGNDDGIIFKKDTCVPALWKRISIPAWFADLCAECVLEEEKKRQAIRGYELYAEKNTQRFLSGRKTGMKLRSTDGRSWKSTGQREFLW